MSDKFVLLVNGGLYHSDCGKNMGTLAQWKEELIKWNSGSMIFEDGENEEHAIDEMLTILQQRSMECFSKAMVERGDDFVELELVKLAE